MRHGEPIWQDIDPDLVVTWTPAEPPRTIEGPLALDLFTDRMLALELADGQVALLTSGGEVRRVLLDGLHQLRVGTGPQDVSPDARLVFVRPDVPVRWRWSHASRLHVPVPGGRTVDVPLQGSCAVAVSDPIRLHDAVLASLDDLPADRLRGVLDTLVRSHLEQRLAGLADHHHLDPVRAEVHLEALRPDDLDDELAELGLTCRELTAAVAPASGERDVAEGDPSPIVSYDDLL
ncbi:hypothetical protein GF314_06130 [bacterium]|nr:hypothetical protein [bacterium]